MADQMDRPAADSLIFLWWCNLFTCSVKVVAAASGRKWAQSGRKVGAVVGHGHGQAAGQRDKTCFLSLDVLNCLL